MLRQLICKNYTGSSVIPNYCKRLSSIEANLRDLIETICDTRIPNKWIIPSIDICHGAFGSVRNLVPQELIIRVSLSERVRNNFYNSDLSLRKTKRDPNVGKILY